MNKRSAILVCFCAYLLCPATGLAETIEGWNEILKSGTLTNALPQERADLVARLNTFLDKQKSTDSANPKFIELKSKAARVASASAISNSLESCALDSASYKDAISAVKAGAELAMTCTDESFGQKELVPLAQLVSDVQLIQVAKSLAQQNLATIKAQTAQLKKENVVAELIPSLQNASRSQKRLLNRVNEQLLKARNQSEAEAIAKKVLNEEGTGYRAEYAAMLQKPWRALLMTPSMIEKIGPPTSPEELRISGSRVGRSRTIFKAETSLHPTQVTAAEIEKARAEHTRTLEAANQRLNSGQADLGYYLKNFPVSLGQALVATDAGPERIKEICGILQQLERTDRFKQAAWQALDLGLTGASLFGGVAGLGLRLVGKAVLSRALAAGAASAAAGATTSEMIRALDHSGKSQEAFLAAAANGNATNDPSEANKLNAALEAYKGARNEAILTGGMSAAGSLAYLTAVRAFSQTGNAAEDIAQAAKTVKMNERDDKSFARAYSALFKCL